MRELSDALSFSFRYGGRHTDNLSQATIPVIKNKSLLDNIRPSEDFIRVDGIGGHIIIDQVGDLSEFGTVYYDPNALANVLSFATVEDAEKMNYLQRTFSFHVHFFFLIEIIFKSYCIEKQHSLRIKYMKGLTSSTRNIRAVAHPRCTVNASPEFHSVSSWARGRSLAVQPWSSPMREAQKVQATCGGRG